MLRKSTDRNPDDFWREYEEKIGDKILAHGLGRYISGQEEFDSKKWNDIWGLLLISEAGFRFHHFPQQNWLESLVVRGNTPGSREKIIFVPKEKIIKAEIHKETRWWVKLFASGLPILVIKYRDEDGNEHKMLLEADMGSKELEEKLDCLQSLT